MSINNTESTRTNRTTKLIRSVTNTKIVIATKTTYTKQIKARLIKTFKTKAGTIRTKVKTTLQTRLIKTVRTIVGTIRTKIKSQYKTRLIKIVRV